MNKTKMIYQDPEENNLTIEFTDKSKKVNVNYLNKKHTFDYDFCKKYKLMNVARFVMRQLSIERLTLIEIESK